MNKLCQQCQQNLVIYFCKYSMFAHYIKCIQQQLVLRYYLNLLLQFQYHFYYFLVIRFKSVPVNCQGRTNQFCTYYILQCVLKSSVLRNIYIINLVVVMSHESPLEGLQQKDNMQEHLAYKITGELDENIFKMNDLSKTTSVEEYFRNIDERVNCKIAAGMKKAVHLLVDKFDILLQNRLNLVLTSKVKDEVDQRLRVLRQISQAKAVCTKCKSVQRKAPAGKAQDCANCVGDVRNADHRRKSPTVKQIRTKVRERVDRSIEHHQQRLQSPRTRGKHGAKYPYKSPNRFFESQESSIRSVEELQYSLETSPANILTRSPNGQIHSPLADASFCSSDKAGPCGAGPSLEQYPTGSGLVREKGPKKLVNIRIQSKEPKGKRGKQDSIHKVNVSYLHNKSRNSFAAPAKSTRAPAETVAPNAKRAKEPKMKRNASKVSVGESQARQPAAKKSNDALKLRQDEYVEKLPVGYPMELKDDLIDSRLKWLSGTQQVSAPTDDIDEIYKEQDPIEESLDQRKKHNGFINNYSVVRTKKREKRKFFFFLRAKLPEQNSIFEVSPVELMSQLRKQERAEAIRVIDESYHQRNPNVILPQSSNSSSRVKISGSQSTQKLDDRSDEDNSVISDQHGSINNEEYKPAISSSQAKHTYTDSRRYSESEQVGYVEKLPSGQPVKRKPDQIFKQAFLQEKTYQSKSSPGSQEAPEDSIKAGRPSPDKWVVLDQSSQDALKDIKLAHSFEKSADHQQLSLDQNLLSPLKSQLNSPDQKFAINTISDNSGVIAPISPIDYPLHPVYSPEKHQQMQHALIQQQSPEKIHFETFEKRGEEPGITLQLRRVQSEQKASAPTTPPQEENSPSGDAAEAEAERHQSEDQAKQTPPRPPAGEEWSKGAKKDELLSDSLPESPQQVPKQNELKELERETPFNYQSQDFSLDISHDRELVESHTPLNSQMQMRSEMTNNAPPSMSPQKLDRTDPLASTVDRTNVKEVCLQDVKEDGELAAGIQEGSLQEQSTLSQQSKSRRENESPKQPASPLAKKPAQEQKSPQEQIQEIQQRTMEELGLLQGANALQPSDESLQVLGQPADENTIKPIAEEKSQEGSSSRSMRIDVSALDLADQSTYIKELEMDAKKHTRKHSATHQLSQLLEKNSDRRRASGDAQASTQPSTQQHIQMGPASNLNTVQALERALGQVKGKRTPASAGQPDLQRHVPEPEHQDRTHYQEQIQSLNSQQSIHKSEGGEQQSRSQSPRTHDSSSKKAEDEDVQLQKMMDQFEVLDDREAEEPRQLGEQAAAPEFIDENEIDEAINEVLESQSLNFNKELKSSMPINEGCHSVSDISLSTNHKALQLENFQERFVTQIIQPFQDDQIEDIKVVKGHEGQSSGVVSIFQEMEKRLLVETSPRKGHGQRHIEFEQPSRDSPPGNPQTSPRQYQADNMGIVEKSKSHTRQTSALLGQAANTSDSAAPFPRGADVTPRAHHSALGEILQLLQKNSFIRDLGQDNMMKLAAEMQKVVYQKNEQIVRFGDISQNYYILHKGKIKVTEYEPSTSPHDLDLENKIALVKYINKEGHGFGEDSIKNFTPLKASIDAMDHCEFYILDGFLINEILAKVSQDRRSSIKESVRQRQIQRRLSEHHLSDDQERVDSSLPSFPSNIPSKIDNIEKANFMPESFLTDSQSSRRIRAASYCPVKVGQGQTDPDDLLNCDLSAIRQKEQPSISASSSSVSPNLKDMTYASFVEHEDHYGLCLREVALFGDRVPTGHKKVRVLSKSLSQLYWVTANERGHYYITLQIPRTLPNFASRVRMLQAEQDFYHSIRNKKEMQKYLFPFEGVHSPEGNPDVWQLHRMDQRKDAFRSLYDSLFEVTFDQRTAASKMYDIQHSAFYSLISQRKGRRHLARLIQKICDFLVQLQDAGIVYGGLRAENIMIRLDDEQTEIQQVKFVDFGSTARMERAAEMIVPDRIEHCPPDLLRNLIDVDKFQKGHRQTAEQLRATKRKINEISDSVVVYSLGVILLQITAGCPTQLPLPLRFRQKTVKGQQFVGATPFGSWPTEYKHTTEQVKQVIQQQESFAGHMKQYFQKNDLYKLTQDDDFHRLLQGMLQKEHNRRPTVREILSDRFVKKWTKH